MQGLRSLRHVSVIAGLSVLALGSGPGTSASSAGGTDPVGRLRSRRGLGQAQGGVRPRRLRASPEARLPGEEGNEPGSFRSQVTALREDPPGDFEELLAVAQGLRAKRPHEGLSDRLARNLPDWFRDWSSQVARMAFGPPIRIDALAGLSGRVPQAELDEWSPLPLAVLEWWARIQRWIQEESRPLRLAAGPEAAALSFPLPDPERVEAALHALREHPVLPELLVPTVKMLRFLDLGSAFELTWNQTFCGDLPVAENFWAPAGDPPSEGASGIPDPLRLADEICARARELLQDDPEIRSEAIDLDEGLDRVLDFEEPLEAGPWKTIFQVAAANMKDPDQGPGGEVVPGTLPPEIPARSLFGATPSPSPVVAGPSEVPAQPLGFPGSPPALPTLLSLAEPQEGSPTPAPLPLGDGPPGTAPRGGGTGHRPPFPLPAVLLGLLAGAGGTAWWRRRSGGSAPGAPVPGTGSPRGDRADPAQTRVEVRATGQEPEAGRGPEPIPRGSSKPGEPGETQAVARGPVSGSGGGAFPGGGRSGGEAVGSSDLPAWLAAALGPINTRYTHFKLLGSGGMGTVVQAWDETLHRHVAIKVPPPHLSSLGEFRERFLREARALARLGHENIARVFDVVLLADGLPAMVLEFLEGRDLGEELRAGGVPKAGVALGWVVQAGRGLAHAHGQGIIHRDVKPANLMLCKGGPVKLLDFGLAAMHDAGGLTRSGILMGSLPYMPPEQLRGERVAEPADQFALTATAFQLLTGELPHDPEDRQRIRPRTLASVRPGMPDVLDRVLARGMAGAAEERYPSVQAFLEALIEAARSASRTGV